MTLEEYLNPLLKNFRDIRTIKKYRVCIQWVRFFWNDVITSCPNLTQVYRESHHTNVFLIFDYKMTSIFQNRHWN